MHAFVRHDAYPEMAEVQRVRIPEPKPVELLVHVSHCGLCGSDVRLHREQLLADSVPLILGHEIVGTVVEGGSEVDRAWIGRRVAVLSIWPCGNCKQCRRKRTNLCINKAIPGVTRDGGLADYVAVPNEFAIGIPDTLDFSRAVLIEPLAVAIHAVDVALEASGLERAAVISGPGPVGILAGIVLAEQGWRVTIVGTERDRLRRLPVAEQLGFDVALSSESGKILNLRQGHKLWIEASGSAQAFQSSLAFLGPGGVLCAVGIPHHEVTLDLATALRQEVRIHFSYGYERVDFDRAITLLASSPLDGLSFSDFYPLSRISQALMDIDAGVVMKPIVVLSGAETRLT